jgi:hypothetical protein
MTKPTKSGSGGPQSSRPGAGANKAPGAKATGNVGAKASAAGTKGAPNRAQSKKIVNQRQTPWGLIIGTVLVVALAIGIIGYAVSKGSKKNDSASNNADKIAGIVHKSFPSGNHVNGVIKYAESPPMGGPHAPIWADCTGTVYPNQIASENAVHDLEHGAVWITYKPGLAAAQVDVLTKLVAGQQYMILTPYAGLKTNISLQAWGYQLFLDDANDARVKQFISALRLSQTNTPELGASCTNATFKTTPSTPGHPIDS